MILPKPTISEKKISDAMVDESCAGKCCLLKNSNLTIKTAPAWLPGLFILKLKIRFNDHLHSGATACTSLLDLKTLSRVPTPRSVISMKSEPVSVMTPLKPLK